MDFIVRVAVGDCHNSVHGKEEEDLVGADYYNQCEGQPWDEEFFLISGTSDEEKSVAHSQDRSAHQQSDANVKVGLSCAIPTKFKKIKTIFVGLWSQSADELSF